MERSAIQSFLKQLDERWPNRNKDFDLIENEFFSFHSNLGDEKEFSDKLIDEIIDFVKNGKDDKRISAVFYKGMFASGEEIDKFWKWQNGGSYNNELITIRFNKETMKNFKKFQINLLTKPKKPRRGPNQFPGTNVLQFKKRNRSVKKLQEKLVSQGFFIDEKEIGYYGSQTCYAVKRYYREVLGVYSGSSAQHGTKFGPKAWERLYS